MKILLSLALFFAVNLFAFTWAKSFDEAKKEAATSGKTVMLVLSQDGCNMCDYLKYVVLKNADVISEIDGKFIPIEVDIHKGKIPDGFRAFGTPTIYFTDASGRKIGRQFVGAAKPDAFLDVLRRVGK